MVKAEIGGRNLLKNTNQQFDWDISNASVAESKSNKITIASQSALDIINSSDEIVFSFLLKAENLEFVQSNQFLGLELRINFEDGSYSFIRANHRRTPDIEPVTYEWKRYYNVIKIGENVKSRGKIISYSNSATVLMRGATGKVSIKNFMLTSGNRPLDHSLAPEDYIKEDLKHSSVTYAHAKLKIDDFWNRGIFGTNIKIGIVDDGVGTHDALPVEGGYACGKYTSFRQENAHATHCAGIALARNLKNGEPIGIAPGAKLYSIRMYYATYVDRVNSLIEAIDYAIDEGIDILSMSIHIAENSVNLGDGRGSSQGIPKHMRIKLRDAFIKAYEHGIIICVAAGNHNKGDGKDNIEFEEFLPKMPNVIVVANLSPDDSRYATSGVGSWVDLAGYGYRVKSTLPDNKYGYLTGTSMSTPQIAGIFALYKQMFPKLTPQKIIELVFKNCEPVPNLSEEQQGRGVPLPPSELYELSVLLEAENRIRVQKDLTWIEAETFSRKNNVEWIRVEAVGYEK